MLSEIKLREKFKAIGAARLGEFGEKVWGAVFASSNVPYIPLHLIENGGAPMLEGEQRTVLPDFDCTVNGSPTFLDSKAKTTSVLYRKSNEERHGFNRRCWDSYLKAGESTGRKCGIGIVELFRYGIPPRWSGTLLIESLFTLGKPIFGFSNQAHMVYWPRERFRILQSFSASSLVGISRGNITVSFSDVIIDTFSQIETLPQTICRQTTMW